MTLVEDFTLADDALRHAAPLTPKFKMAAEAGVKKSTAGGPPGKAHNRADKFLRKF